MRNIHRRAFELSMVLKDGRQLSTSQQAFLEEHLATCNICRTDQDIYANYQNHAGTLFTEPPAARIDVGQILLMKPRSLNPWRRPLLAAVWIVTAAAALILIQWAITTLRPGLSVWPARVKTPKPQVFDSAGLEMTTFARLPFESKHHFGAAVSLDGTALAAGAPNWGYPGEGAGNVYIYRLSITGEWVLEADLTASDKDDGYQYDQHFGEAVALNGRLLAVGAPGYDDPQAGSDVGAVYLFEYDGSGWKETGKLIPRQKTTGARMGSSLAFDGDLLVACGSPLAGNVATFKREIDGWRELTSLPVPQEAGGKPVYTLVDLYGNSLAVSTVAWQDTPQGADEASAIKLLLSDGMVTVYDLHGSAWKKVFKTAAQEASLLRMRPDAPFGLPVSLSGTEGQATLLAVGKPGFTDSGRELGSVLVYQKTRKSWIPQAELSLKPGDAVPGGLPFFGPDPGAVFFGGNVDLEGSRLAVISTFANTVYIFDYMNGRWQYLARISPGAEYMDDFMRRVTVMDQDSLVLGSPGDLGGGNVFVFTLPE